MSSFHRQAFLSWSLIFKHNFSTNKNYIWNNKDILFKHKSLFIDYWFNNNIIFVDQLFNRDGCPYSYNEFLENTKFLCLLEIMPKSLEQFPLVSACYIELNQDWTHNN